MDAKNAMRVLKSIEMVNCDQHNVKVGSEPSDNNSEKKDYLLEALGAGSKPFNKYESGYAATVDGEKKPQLKLGRVPWYSIKRVEAREDPLESDRVKVERIRRL